MQQTIMKTKNQSNYPKNLNKNITSTTILNKSKSKSKIHNGTINTQPSIAYKNQVVMIENFLKKSLVDKPKESISKDIQQVQQQNQENESILKSQQIKSGDEISVCQDVNTSSMKIVDQSKISQIDSNSQVKVNPRLLQPVLKTSHIPHELHFKRTKRSQNSKEKKDSSKSHSRNINQSCISHQIQTNKSTSRNYSRNDGQPIKSLKRQMNHNFSVCNINDINNLSVEQQALLTEINNSNNFTIGQQPLQISRTCVHSHKQSWQMNSLPYQNQLSLNNLNMNQSIQSKIQENNHQSDLSKNFHLQTLSTIQFGGRYVDTSVETIIEHDQQLENNYSNSVQNNPDYANQIQIPQNYQNSSDQKTIYDEENSQNPQFINDNLQEFDENNRFREYNQQQVDHEHGFDQATPKYMIDLAYSNEKQSYDQNASFDNFNRQRAFSQFNYDNQFIQSEQTFKQNYNQNNKSQATISELQFQSIDFRSHYNQGNIIQSEFKSSQTRRTRRELCLSQSSGQLKTLVDKLKSQIRQSKSRSSKTQFDSSQTQGDKENLQSSFNIQNENRLRSTKDLMKRNSQYRFENIKQELNKNLNEYKRSRERLEEAQKQITPIKDQNQIRKVSAFAQSVLSFSQKIDKLITAEKRSQSRQKLSQVLGEQQRNKFNQQNFSSISTNERISKASKRNSSNYNSINDNLNQGKQVKTKLEKENIDEYVYSAKKQYQKLKQKSKLSQEFIKDKKLIRPQVLQHKMKQVLPNIKLTYIDMNSSSSSISQQISSKPEINSPYLKNYDEEQIEHISVKFNIDRLLQE